DADAGQRRACGVVEERLADARHGQALVRGALAVAPLVHLDPAPRTAPPRRADVDRRRLVVDQPPPGGGRTVAEHRPRTGVEHRRRQISFDAGRVVADGVDARKLWVEVALVEPVVDHRVDHAELSKLKPRDASALPRRGAPDTRPLFSFACAAVRVKLRPASFRNAALYTSSRVASISADRSASFAWMAWNREIGCPKARRSRA